MKNKIIIIISALLISIAIYIVYTNTDNYKFASEYNSLNGKKTESGKTYLKVNIKTNNVKYTSYKEVFDILDSKTGIIYFGFPECPWCRNALPVLLEAADDQTIYYFNNKEDRDTKELLEDGTVKTTKESTKDYKKLIEKLGDYADTYDGLNDENIKRLYYPTVLFVKNGKIIDKIVSTVDSQKDPYKPLTSKQTKELKEKYQNAISKMQTCSNDEKC